MKLLQINVAETSNAAEAIEPTVETLSILELFLAGGWYIMLPLVALSIVSVYIFIERYLAIQKASKDESNFMNNIKQYIHDGKVDAAISLCKNSDTPYARLIEKGISRIGKPLNDISAAIENVGKLEIYKLEKSLATLATVAGAAPMIGFLGTVVGMIFTFHEMKISGNSVEISQLSGGIMQAMVTTVAGLIVGIIAYIGYNLLVAKVEKVVYKLEVTTIEFMDLLQEPV
jgi:biopolymer transport protein ExbB